MSGRAREPMQSVGEALLTDLYQLTMAQAYFELGMKDDAVFELFVRRLPATRRFLLAAGLEQALEYIAGLKFTADDIAFLATLGRFRADFSTIWGACASRAWCTRCPREVRFSPTSRSCASRRRFWKRSCSRVACSTSCTSRH